MSSSGHPAVAALLAVLAKSAGGADWHTLEVESLVAHRYGSEGELGYLISLRGSSPYFVGPDGTPQQVEITSKPRIDDEVEVDFKKTGGLAGTSQHLKLSEHDGTVTVEDAAALKNWLSEVDFFDISEDTSGPTHNDGFTYSITASYGRRRRSMVVQEGRGNATIARLGPLIHWLESKVSGADPMLVLD